MVKKHFKDLDTPVSPLGFGVMRLPMNADGNFSSETHSLLAHAYESGINYFDTAYTYLGGQSEVLIRQALVDRFPRSTFYIADKLPVWECKNRADMERIFEEQLNRLGTDYIDFYLLHSMHKTRWLDIHNKGVLDFLDEKKSKGQIRMAGFSLHDRLDALMMINESYDWDFIQLQINYYDWIAQQAKESYEYLEKQEIPCMVMEPVGGGRLVNLPTEAQLRLKGLRPDDSIASWAIRYVASLPNVAVTLSGMNDKAQLDDNLKTFREMEPFTEEEEKAIDDVINILVSFNNISCTTCNYCIETCPKGIDIPQIFNRYNDSKMFDNMASFDIDYFTFIPDSRQGYHCISCGKCEKQCPQNIEISKLVKIIHEEAVGMSLGADIDSLKKAKMIVCFGAGEIGERALKSLRLCGIEPAYFCDNAERLWGTHIEGVEVISPDSLKKLEDSLVLITSSYKNQIEEQLKELKII